MNQLVTQSTDLATDVGETTEISWTAPANLTFDQYQQIGRTFQQIQRSLNWWMGDWMNEGEMRFEEMYLQAVEETSKAVETLIKWKAVAQRVPKNVRQVNLSWTHHFYVAYTEIEHRGPLLQTALNVGLSSRELKEVAKLRFELRADLIVAAQEGIDHESFMRLLNTLKLGEVKPSQPKVEIDDEEDDDDEELPFSDLDEDDEPALPKSKHPGLGYDDVLDFWENSNLPLTVCTAGEALWEGIMVRAAINEAGKPILVWEEMLT